MTMPLGAVDDNNVGESQFDMVLPYINGNFSRDELPGKVDNPIIVTPFPRVMVSANQRSVLPAVVVRTHGIPFLSVPRCGP